MTDTLPEIVVVGQRRRNSSLSFPSAGGGGGGSNNPGGVNQWELEEEGAEDPPPATGPCSDPDTALEWNADAAAAEALRRMQEDADDPLLDGRERGFVLWLDPASQTVQLGQLAVGENMAGAVTPDLTGIDPANIIGFIHSHPGSGPYLSGPDRDLFGWFQGTISAAGGDPGRLRFYMVGTRDDGDGTARLQIRVYNETNTDGDANNPGPEVNQDAEPCPA